MRYFTILLVGSLVVFSPLYTWGKQQDKGQKQEFKAADPIKDPHAYQDKDGFPTGAGCTVPEGYFERLDKIMKSNPRAPATYNPRDPCSVQADPETAR